MKKKLKLIVLGIIVLSIVLMVFIVVTKKSSSVNGKDNVNVNRPIVESVPDEKLVIPQNDYNNRLPNPPGIMFDYYEGWEKVQIEIIHGEIMLDKIEGPGYEIVSVGNKYEISKDNQEEIYLMHGIEVYEKYEGERLFYAYFTFLEDEHIVAQSLVVSREDMEKTMNEVYDGDSTTTYYAIPIKEVQYKKIDGEYQNVTKEYADAWLKSNMEEYEIKKAVETIPEKSRFKIIEDYTTDYKKNANDDKVYELKGIGIVYEIENDKQYVEAGTDNGQVAVWKKDYLKISTNQKVERLSGTSMICWFESDNLEKDKYNDRVAYLRLTYKENLKVLGLALIKIEYKDDTKTSYTTQIKEVAYKSIDGRSQPISIFTEEAWFERAIKEFEQEIAP